jgi:hypothetical protein
MANVAGKAKRTRTDSVVEPAPEPVEPQIPDLKTTAEHLVYGCPSAQISPTSLANIQLTALQPSRSRHRDKSQDIARRSPHAREMIRFLGKMPDFSADDPAAQLFALRGIAGDLSDPSWAWLSDAVTSYLDLVDASLST